MRYSIVCLRLSAGWRRRLCINCQRSEREIRSETGRAGRGVNEKLRLPSDGRSVSHAGGDRRNHSTGSHEGKLCVCLSVCLLLLQTGTVFTCNRSNVIDKYRSTLWSVCSEILILMSACFPYRLIMGWSNSCCTFHMWHQKDQKCRKKKTVRKMTVWT